jgi:microcompartment protein CcmL/EutN
LTAAPLTEALGILETTGYTPAIVALDAMEKAAGVRLAQAELNDFLGVCLKVFGPTASVKAALAAAVPLAEQMGGKPKSTIIPRPDEEAWKAIDSKAEYNQTLQQDVVYLVDPAMAETTAPSYALGLIETQGFTAVFEAIDSACKAANVEVVGKEKLGGGYITVVVKGDVAAVKAAVDAGKAKVEGLGKLIAAHVIARPSSAVMTLLPK